MNKTQIKAEIVADSINQQNKTLMEILFNTPVNPNHNSDSWSTMRIVQHNNIKFKFSYSNRNGGGDKRLEIFTKNGDLKYITDGTEIGFKWHGLSYVDNWKKKKIEAEDLFKAFQDFIIKIY